MIAALLATFAGSCTNPTAHQSPARDWPLVYAQDFAAPASLNQFVCSDPARWRLSDAGGTPSLELLGKSSYRPAVRSPTSLAVLRDVEFADFDLQCDVLQTGPEYGHRDLCLFFGLQSAQRFYYVHLATTPDPNAHNVFVVDDAPRSNLADVPPRGIDWGDGEWHHVRIERRVAAGTIAVYWDGAAAPLLQATDTRHGWGRIGLGSFDDSGRFTNLRVWAPATRPATGELAFRE